MSSWYAGQIFFTRCARQIFLTGKVERFDCRVVECEIKELNEQVEEVGATPGVTVTYRYTNDDA